MQVRVNAITWRESKLPSVCRSGWTSAGAGTTKFAVLNYWEIEERKSFCRRAVTKKWHRNINGANSNKNKSSEPGYSKEVKVNYWINFSMLSLRLDTKMLHGVTIFFLWTEDWTTSACLSILYFYLCIINIYSTTVSKFFYLIGE